MSSRYSQHHFKEKNSSVGYLLLLIAFSFVSTYGYGYGIKAHSAVIAMCLLLVVNHRLLHNLLVLILAMVPVCYYPTALTAGSSNYNVVLSLFYTDKQESFEYLSNIPLHYFIPSLSLVIISYLLMRTVGSKPILTTGWKQLLVLTAVIIAGVGPTRAYLRDDFGFNESTIKYIPARFWIGGWDNYKRVRKDMAFYQRMINSKTDWTPTLIDKPIETMVIVIGESVRRDRMSAYGFHIDTTPWLKQAKGTLFTNYSSAGPATVISLNHTLFHLDPTAPMMEIGEYDKKSEIEFNNSITTLFKEAGYNVSWISNQRFVGKNDSAVSLIGQQANKHYFIKKEWNVPYEIHDDKLLPYIKEDISAKGPKVIFVHLAGSHPPACRRTDDQYDEFYRSTAVSCYLKSLKNDDKLLEEIEQSLKQTKQSWALSYIADHGLFTFDKDTANERYIHGDKYKSDFDVPFFVGTDKDTKHILNNKPRTGFQFMAMMAQLAHIKEPKLSLPCQFRQEEDCLTERFVIDRNGNKVNYNTFKDEE